MLKEEDLINSGYVRRSIDNYERQVSKSYFKKIGSLYNIFVYYCADENLYDAEVCFESSYGFFNVQLLDCQTIYEIEEFFSNMYSKMCME